MATTAQWIEGARPRTLPVAVAPVLAGTAVAAHVGDPVWWKAAFALVVSLALQVGVNYANDYSDGIRGTDDERVGPLRLVGSGVATPSHVKAAAFGCFGMAAVAGLVLAVATAWWLVVVGVLCIVAAWYYTGGSTPYGYLGLGEVMVFVFFGLVAVGGTTYVQLAGTGGGGGTPWAATLAAAVAIGALACAILVANNLRDIGSDTLVGKRTLAVILGDRRTRGLYAALAALALVGVVVLGAVTSWWALLGLIGLVPVARATRSVLSGAQGRTLIGVLAQTGAGDLLLGAGVFVGLLIS